MNAHMNPVSHASNLRMNISTKTIGFQRAKKGIWGWRHDRTESVGEYPACRVYHVTGLRLVTRKRREHLTEEEIRRNKAIISHLKSSHTQANLTTVDQTSAKKEKHSTEKSKAKNKGNGKSKGTAFNGSSS